MAREAESLIEAELIQALEEASFVVCLLADACGGDNSEDNKARESFRKMSARWDELIEKAKGV